MSEELFHTSAPHGLRPGTGGFCTVAMTAGLSPLMEERLTLLSGYRWISAGSGAGAAVGNPVAWAHWRLSLAGKTVSVLSRVADAGMDHSRRSNRFAHHLVLEPHERGEAGPAWLLRQPGLLETAWVGEPRIIDRGRPIPGGDNPPRVCSAWAAVAHDAGWGGVLAEAFAQDPSRVAWLIFPPGVDLLQLFDESLALIPPARRWDVTFNTYFTELPAGVICAWRGCPAGSRAASEALRNPGGALVLDLTRKAIAAPTSWGAQAARAGMFLSEPSISPATPIGTTQRRTEPLLAVALPYSEEAKPGATAVAAGETTDDSAPDAQAPGAVDEWMPPVSATIVDYAAAPQNKRPHWVGWAIAAACLLLSAGVIFWFLASAWQSQTQARLAQAQQAVRPPDMVFLAPTPTLPLTSIPSVHVVPDTLPAEEGRVTELQAQLAALKSQKQKLEADLDASRQTSAEIGLQDAKIASLAAELHAARTDLDTRPARRPAQIIRDSVPAPDVLDDRIVLWQSPVGAVLPERIELVSPIAPAGMIAAQPDLARLIVRPADKPLAVDAAGNMVATDLAVIQLKNGRLTFEWRDKKKFTEIGGASSWLALSRVRVLHQKDELAAVQPAGPLNIRLNVSDVVAILPDRRGAAADQLALLPPAESPDGWTVQKAIEPLTINVTSELNPAAHFEVVLDLSGPVGTVRATWREHRLELANQPDDLKAMDSLPPMILPIRFNPTGAIVSNIMLRVDHPPAH